MILTYMQLLQLQIFLHLGQTQLSFNATSSPISPYLLIRVNTYHQSLHVSSHNKRHKSQNIKTKPAQQARRTKLQHTCLGSHLGHASSNSIRSLLTALQNKDHFSFIKIKLQMTRKKKLI